jgi:hypothetical protein
MEDKANVLIKDRYHTNHPPVFFYTHWRGSELDEIVGRALDRGRGRWGDTSYLARILFRDMIEGSEKDTVGFGIYMSVHDNQIGRPIIVVDDHNRTVGLAHESTPTEVYTAVDYGTFIKNPKCLGYK